jgi:hypothetical protein
LENAVFCTITRQHSPVGLRFLKTAKEPEKMSARISLFFQGIFKYFERTTGKLLFFFANEP